MRFYPITPRLSRVCVKDYNRPELGLNIPKGSAVDVPVATIHRDPEHFDNPEEFDPEHFNEESKAKRHGYAYMPFGVGPRNCIGKMNCLFFMIFFVQNFFVVLLFLMKVKI